MTEIVYDIAPDAEYWLVNYHTPDQFKQAVDYLHDVVHPDVVVHSNSFLFGPFDGSGFFAQQVDRLAAQGTIWVNSVGNYRENHWEGPYADADADGYLDVPAHGDDFPVALIVTQRPACDLSVSGPGSESALDHYTIGLFLDPAGTQPVLDARSGQPLVSAFTPAPEPHDSLAPGFLPAAGTYHLKILKVGNPPTGHLTLFCRFALPVDAQTLGSSVPDPGRRAREPLDRRVRREHARARAVLVRGADRRRASQARPRRADQRGDHRRLVRRHLVRSAARGGCRALLLADTPAASVPDTLRAWALDAGDPGLDSRFGAGRLRVDLDPPALGSPTAPSAGGIVDGVLAFRLPLVESGTLDAAAVELDGTPIPAVVGPDRVVSGSIDTRLLPDGSHVLRLDARDRVGNAGTANVTFTTDNTPPTVRVEAPALVLAGHILRASAIASDSGSGLPQPPSWTLGDGSSAVRTQVQHRYSRPGRYTLTASATDGAGNSASARRAVRVVALLLSPATGSSPAIRVALARPGRVRVKVGGALVRTAAGRPRSTHRPARNARARRAPRDRVRRHLAGDRLVRVP